MEADNQSLLYKSHPRAENPGINPWRKASTSKRSKFTHATRWKRALTKLCHILCSMKINPHILCKHDFDTVGVKLVLFLRLKYWLQTCSIFAADMDSLALWESFSLEQALVTGLPWRVKQNLLTAYSRVRQANKSISLKNCRFLLQETRHNLSSTYNLSFLCSVLRIFTERKAIQIFNVTLNTTLQSTSCSYIKNYKADQSDARHCRVKILKEKLTKRRLKKTLFTYLSFAHSSFLVCPW